jgi:BirA family biotin operon repressor/biotin-[acetyl-CoA-carboxylase] ligase
MPNGLIQSLEKRNIFPMPAVERFDSLPSTNDYLKQLLTGKETSQKELPRLPCIVSAETQTAGRGRGNNIWWSGSGSLAVSLGWNLQDKGINREQLPLLAPAVADAVIQAVKNTVEFNWQNILTIKLPNDIYAEGKKLGGILIESPGPLYAVIGIGLNVNNSVKNIPFEFQETFTNREITSLVNITERETDLNELTAEIVLQVDIKVHLLRVRL